MGIATVLKRAAGNRVTPGMKEALKRIHFELRARRISAKAVSSFSALRGRRNLKVQLGAGDDLRQGWVNIDLALRFNGQRPANNDGETVFINYDLRRGLPLYDGSCSLIYSSHFFEHLTFQDGLALMAECHRVLQSRGVFRFALPDVIRLFDAYKQQDTKFLDLIDIKALYPDLTDSTSTWVDYLNYGVYQFGEHVALYDAEKAIALLRTAGFESVRQVDADDNLDPPDELRRRYSFYVEAVK